MLENRLSTNNPAVGVRLFTTCLTRSAVSRYLGLFFYDFEHTFHVSAHALVPFERVTILRR
jgi:hypothetical protein